MSLITQHLHLTDRDITERLCRIETMLGSILEKLETFKMSFDADVARAKAAEDSINAKLDAIKADVEALLAKLAAVPTPGMTPEQEAAMKEIADGLEALAAKAGAVDDMNP